MATLELSTADRNKVRALWGDAMAMNDYKTENVIHELFSELCRTSEDARDLFSNKKVRAEQELLFAEIMGFTMMYLHNLEILDECVNEFIKENPHIVKCGVRYLEPMGGVMIGYLRKTLGAQFHAGLETLWVKTYIYIANCILQNDELEVELLLSEGEHKSLELETELLEETAPLKVPARAPLRASARPITEPVAPVAPLLEAAPAPVFKSSPLPRLETSNNEASTISINLQNEKYRGFRRSVTESPQEPVQVKVPATLVGAKNSAPEYDPQLTPRSSRRKLNAGPVVGLGLDTTNDDFEVKSKTTPFDPRRSSHHRRTLSDLGSTMEHPQPAPSANANANANANAPTAVDAHRSWSGSLCESPILDVEDEFNLAPPQDEEALRPRGVFDCNSFGIKGLAPIAETEVDEEDGEESSLYGSDNDHCGSKASDESLRTSSLSLHNLDYKSSISLGTGYLPDAAKVQQPGFRSHGSKMSQLSDISFMQLLPAPMDTGFPMMHRNFGSTPSLSARSMYTPGKRASLGFMRSSFVLKKEMEELGYNIPENVSLLKTTSNVSNNPAAPSLAKLTLSRSVASLPLQAPSPQTFATSPATTAAAAAPQRKAQKSKTPSVSSEKTKKSGFRAKLGSIFGSKELKAEKLPAPRKISSPINVPVPPSSQDAMKVGPTKMSKVPHHQPVKRPVKAPSPAKPSYEKERRRSSVCSSAYEVSTINTTSRVSAADVRRQSKQPPVGYAASVYSRPVVNDNSSIYSNELTVSGFSFFKSKSKTRYEKFDDEKKKKNKYNVKKVPYRTVYVKDIIR